MQFYKSNSRQDVPSPSLIRQHLLTVDSAIVLLVNIWSSCKGSSKFNHSNHSTYISRHSWLFNEIKNQQRLRHPLYSQNTLIRPEMKRRKKSGILSPTVITYMDIWNPRSCSQNIPLRFMCVHLMSVCGLEKQRKRKTGRCLNMSDCR